MIYMRLLTIQKFTIQVSLKKDLKILNHVFLKKN